MSKNSFVILIQREIKNPGIGSLSGLLRVEWIHLVVVVAVVVVVVVF